MGELGVVSVGGRIGIRLEVQEVRDYDTVLKGECKRSGTRIATCWTYRVLN
jgi:hypothetical protein